MFTIRITLAAICALMLCGYVASCTTLALEGDRKYKVDLTNVLVVIRDEISNEGEVSERSAQKLDGVLAKYEEKYGRKGSFQHSSDIPELIKSASANPETSFDTLQQIQHKITMILDTLKTEIRD